MFSVVFFFKQKTAYEMRISDWSSDVCSSDLLAPHRLDEIATDAIELAQPLAHRAERLGIGRRILRLIDEAVVEHRLEHVMPPRQRRILVAHGIVIGRPLGQDREIGELREIELIERLAVKTRKRMGQRK